MSYNTANIETLRAEMSCLKPSVHKRDLRIYREMRDAVVVRFAYPNPDQTKATAKQAYPRRLKSQRCLFGNGALR